MTVIASATYHLCVALGLLQPFKAVAGATEFHTKLARSCCDTAFVGSSGGIGAANIADNKVQRASLTDDDQQHLIVGG